jgi:hypothetical protein
LASHPYERERERERDRDREREREEKWGGRMGLNFAAIVAMVKWESGDLLILLSLFFHSLILVLFTIAQG